MGYWRILLTLLTGAILSGCHASPWATSKNDLPTASAAADAAKVGSNKNGSNVNAAKTVAKAGDSQTSQKSSESTAGGKSATEPPSANAQSLQEVMAEVRELGVLDPQEQNKLLEDLRQTDPSLWPLMVKQVRAAVAYRRKSMDRGQVQAAASSPMFASAPIGESPQATANPSDTEENPPQVLPHNNDSTDITKNVRRTPNRMPQTLETAKSSFKNSPNAPLPPEGESGVATANLVSGGKIKKAKTTPAKSIDADDQVMPASYESLAIQHESVKSDSAAIASGSLGDDSASAEHPQSADWRVLLEQTIKAMESDSPEKPKTAEELSKQARLRMLYALAGRREDAAKPIPTAPPAMQDFWAKELYGLTVLLDTERTPDAMSRAAEAKQHLGEGFARIGEMAPLQIRNMSFCTKVQSYGCYTPFKKYEFLPDQEVLLYAEVENFGIESTPKGYHTALRSSYQILDKNGQRIADHANSTTEEYCQNPRRDFFIGYQIQMPKRINPGSYTLQLTIEDMKSQKVGQASVELTIKSGEKEKTER
jgi:hypothetical protein